MFKVLVINCGSSSIKYKLFRRAGKNKLEQIAKDDLQAIDDYEKAIKTILRQIGDLRDLNLVAHRVVHGGEDFKDPVIVDDDVLTRLEQLNDLAPLHNPYNLAGIKAVASYLPAVKQVAVFDTGFYKNLPDYARRYALPPKLVKGFSLYRYGFHGISHEYVLHQASAKLGKGVGRTSIISCHLGGGWSATAVRRGQAIDTSMGMTPLEGLVMMTRCGDIDAGVVMRLLKIYEKNIAQEKANFNNEEEQSKKSSQDQAWQQVWHLLNYESGIKGLTGGISDFRDLLRELGFGRQEVKLAFDLAVYRLAKYIGAYWAILGGQVDAIVFTGNIGAGDSITRRAVKRRLPSLKNIPFLAIPTDEEKMIAQKAIKLLE